jgi:hypothetical protein
VVVDLRAVIAAQLAELAGEESDLQICVFPAEPSVEYEYDRKLLTLPQPPVGAQAEGITVDQARERVRTAIEDYLAIPEPAHALLIKAVPGTGKTTFGILASEMLAEEGRRVLYAGPRHDFYGDIMEITVKPELWYEWLPRQAETPGKVKTCNYPAQIELWMARGYRGIEFCATICKWDYINHACPYHLQRQRHEPCIFGQHQHVTLGHPLEFHVLVGDETPIGAFCWQRFIPGVWVAFPGMEGPFAEILPLLQNLCLQGILADGETLLGYLGGPQKVLSACNDTNLPLSPDILSPHIERAEDVERIPYAFLHQLVPLLRREAEAALAGKQYLHRVVTHGGFLLLYMRRGLDEKLPRHIIWLDATANARLYRACLGRPVQVVDAQPALRGRIHQVVSRANGKGTLINKAGGLTGKVQQLDKQVRRVIETGKYERPAIISFQKVIEGMELFGKMDHSHFYAARGTNALEDCDTLIVAGTPQPQPIEIERMAKMIFQERIEAYRLNWHAETKAYNYVHADGTGRGWRVGGYWGEPDLEAVLWSLREAEIIQAAHRVRPIFRDVDMWLLTNVPIWELPPHRLLTIAELFGAPQEVDVYLWPQVMKVAERCNEERGAVTTVDLVGELGIVRTTALRYIEILISDYGWLRETGASKRGVGGKPPQGARKMKST